ncbi:unnamed protein product [Orchesella dallaii]|uniref:Uncharacterized protein n=1 Tax=Orchesella dallaii TaxID=48710 RepID=A0ABP1QR03_9HEXA
MSTQPSNQQPQSRRRQQWIPPYFLPWCNPQMMMPPYMGFQRKSKKQKSPQALARIQRRTAKYRSGEVHVTNQRSSVVPSAVGSSILLPEAMDTSVAAPSPSKPKPVPFKKVVILKDAQTQTHPAIPVTFPDPRKVVMDEEAQLRKKKCAEQAKAELEKRKAIYAEKLKCKYVRKSEAARKLLAIPETAKTPKRKVNFRPVTGVMKNLPEKPPTSPSAVLGRFDKMVINKPDAEDLFADPPATPTPINRPNPEDALLDSEPEDK